MDLSKLRRATATRHLAGATIPRQDTTSFGMRAAMKKGGSRYAGESGDVEGKAARPRLDRPGRKAGGRVCREEGGSVSRISEDSKQAAAKLRDEAGAAKKNATDAADVGAMGLGARLAMAGTRARIGKPIANIVTGLAGLGVGSNAMKSKRLGDEAGRIERGEAEPGKEDRKNGGKVRR